ncbi:MAG: flagellar biosynthesis protein FlhF, partial [Firmicutes bacterium]|nr:flagellar biosynthesis protein FlhF [Bacillota bacterium]
LINTVRAYEKVTDFKIILTKVDETATIGNILNLCFDTGREISYISNGQDVPDDFEKMMPEKIAKTLLGSMYE